ncbi:MAG: NUDIX domain-containing protein [archaeon]|jgi:mutator protein MutT
MKKSKTAVALIVEAIIKDETGKILLLKRSKKNKFFVDLWQLPGGKVELGENVLHAIKREIIEEISCCPDKIDTNKVLSFQEKFNGFDGTLFLMVFDVECNLKVKLSADHCEFGFFSEKEIKKMDLTPISKKSLFE